jgi:predicted enzyme related to lactoylglutathione lyase
VIAVPSVDDIVKAVTAAGGAVAVPKMAVPTVGWTAYFTDTEGTLFGVMQFDPAAR